MRTQPNRPRPPRHARPGADNSDLAEPAAPTPGGIDPALMQEVLVADKYTANLTRDIATHSAVLQVTDGKSGWSVIFHDCAGQDRCRTMEFYTLWRVQNEAAVCTAWMNGVTKDPTRNLGKPFCYTVPGLDRQLHLKLSSEQAPYADIASLPPPQARERLQAMVGVWQSHLPMLPQAYAIAVARCPRGANKCS